MKTLPLALIAAASVLVAPAIGVAATTDTSTKLAQVELRLGDRDRDHYRDHAEDSQGRHHRCHTVVVRHGDGDVTRRTVCHD